MKIPFVDKVLYVSKHFGLGLNSLFQGSYILRSEYIVDYQEIVINFGDQFIIIAQNCVFTVFVRDNCDLSGFPDGLDLGNHVQKLCLFLSLDCNLNDVVLKVVEFDLVEEVKGVNGFVEIKEQLIN